MLRLVDTHAHLDMFPNLDAALRKARSLGVEAIVAVGSDLKSNVEVLSFSKSHERFVFPSLGLHPWGVDVNFEEALGFIEDEIGRCVAVGEVGLDYWIKKDSVLQRKVFRMLLEIACRHDKPAVVHSRGAWKDAFELVKEVGLRKAVFHWFSGPREVLEAIIASGYLISATPAAEYSLKLREAVAYAPVDRILLETDSPVKYRGTPSEPADILKALTAVSKIKGIEESKLAELTSENAVKFFNLKL